MLHCRILYYTSMLATYSLSKDLQKRRTYQEVGLYQAVFTYLLSAMVSESRYIPECISSSMYTRKKMIYESNYVAYRSFQCQTRCVYRYTEKILVKYIRIRLCLTLVGLLVLSTNDGGSLSLY